MWLITFTVIVKLKDILRLQADKYLVKVVVLGNCGRQRCYYYRPPIGSDVD